MNICVNFLWWLELDDQVDLWDIEASCGNVGCDKTFKFTLLESLESDLPLFLGDVTVQDLGLLFEVGFQQDFIGFPFGLAEDDGSSVSTSVQVDDVSDDGISVVVWAAKGHVFNGFGCSHARILN